MIECIYAIPLAESMEQGTDCPLCFLRARSGDKALQAVLGMAKMEPDVRAQTNRTGFCACHLRALRDSGQRQSMSLLLQSLFWALREHGAHWLSALGGQCYLCARVDGEMAHFYQNFIWLCKKDNDFAQKCLARPDYCLEHTAALLKTGQKLLSRKEFTHFSSALWAALSGRIGAISENLDAFCQSMDYRFSGQALTEGARRSMEEAILFLGGKED